MVPKLTFGAEVHRMVPKLFRANVTRAEHRLPLFNSSNSELDEKCIFEQFEVTQSKISEIS